MLTDIAHADRYTSVGSVARFDPASLDPEGHGVRLGGFTLYPDLKLVSRFDDNVNSSQTNQIDDRSIEVQGSAVLRSNWSQHLLLIGVSGARRQYAERDSLNRTNLAIDIRGGVDVTHATELMGRVRFSIVQSEPGDTNEPFNAAEGTEVQGLMGQLGFKQDFSAFTVSLRGTIRERDFDDVRLNNNTIKDNDVRDRRDTLVFSRIAAPISPAVSLFVQGEMNQRRYDQAPPIGEMVRDSDGYRVGAGVALNLPGRVTGEGHIGYFEQDYDFLPDVDGLAFGGSLDWQATGLTKVDFYAERGVHETTGNTSSAFLRDAFGGRVQHELTRKFLLRGGIELISNEYQPGTRDEAIIATSLGAAWMVSRQITIELAHDWRSRETNIVDSDYDRNVVSLSLSGSF